MQHWHVLVVEDNESDAYLIEEAIAQAGLSVTIQLVRDGESAIHFFQHADAHPDLPCPDLVLLDINLPKRSGFEVLEYIRTSAKCGRIRIAAVTTSDSAQDRDRIEELGGDVYFRKPSDYDEFMKLGGLVKSLLNRPS